jgi:hypothetical protein
MNNISVLGMLMNDNKHTATDFTKKTIYSTTMCSKFILLSNNCANALHCLGLFIQVAILSLFTSRDRQYLFCRLTVA